MVAVPRPGSGAVSPLSRSAPCADLAVLRSVTIKAVLFYILSCVPPLQRGIVTGSADKTVKFWEFELIKDKTSEQK